MPSNFQVHPKGRVKGPGTGTSDSILAYLSNGEYVLPKPAVDLVGKQNLDRVRNVANAASAFTRMASLKGAKPVKPPKGLINTAQAVGNVVGNHPVVKGARMAMQASPLGDGTLGSPEARQAMAQNASTPRFAFGGSTDLVSMANENKRNNRLLGEAGLSAPMQGDAPGAGMRSGDILKAVGPTDAYGNETSLTDRFNKGAEMLRGLREPEKKPDEFNAEAFGKMFSQFMTQFGKAQDGIPKMAKGGEVEEAKKVAQAAARFGRKLPPLPVDAAGMPIVPGPGTGVPPAASAPVTQVKAPPVVPPANVDPHAGIRFQTGNTTGVMDRLKGFNATEAARAAGADAAATSSASRAMLATGARNLARLGSGVGAVDMALHSEPAQAATLLDPSARAPNGEAPVTPETLALLQKDQARRDAVEAGKQTFLGGLSQLANRFIPQVPESVLQQAEANRVRQAENPLKEVPVMKPGAPTAVTRAVDDTVASFKQTPEQAKAQIQANLKPGTAPATDSRPARTDEQRAATQAAALKIAENASLDGPLLSQSPGAKDAQAQGQRIISTDQALGAPAQFVDNAATRGDYTIGTTGSKPAANISTAQGQLGPMYSTDYAVTNKDGKVSTLNITGPSQRKGGGTMSVVPSQSVEDINKQIAALRSLREARNPGITQPRQADPFAGAESAMRDYQSQMAEIQKLRESAPRGRPGDRVQRNAIYAEADARAAAAENALNAQMGLAGRRADAFQQQQAGAAQAARDERNFGLQQAQFERNLQNDRFNQEKGTAEFIAQQEKDRLAYGKDLSKEANSSLDSYISQFKEGYAPPIAQLEGAKQQLLQSDLFKERYPTVAQRFMNGNLSLLDWNLLGNIYEKQQQMQPGTVMSLFKDAPSMDEIIQRTFGARGAN